MRRKFGGITYQLRGGGDQSGEGRRKNPGFGSCQAGDGFAVIECEGAAQVIVGEGFGRNAQGVVDGGGEVFGGLGIGDGFGGDAVGRADDASATGSTSGDEDGLGAAPVIAPWEFVMFSEMRDTRCAAEFPRHDDEGGGEEAAFG